MSTNEYEEDVTTLEEKSLVKAEKRKRNRPKQLKAGAVEQEELTVESPEILHSITQVPNTVTKALNSNDSENWKAAMQREHD